MWNGSAQAALALLSSDFSGEGRGQAPQIAGSGQGRGSQGTPILPGWFGKLPGMGDFAYRRLPGSFYENWDGWLQEGLAGLRARHPGDWVGRYLGSPLWCFALGSDVAGAKAWVGVLMPSVDSVGRYFPFTLACEFDEHIDTIAWWACAARAALDALTAGLNAQRLEALLAQRFGECGASGQAAPLPPGQSSWCEGAHFEDDTGQRLTFTGLPRGAQFDVLFGFAQGLPR